MGKPMIDVTTQITRRIDRLERDNRCRKRSKAVILISALLLLIGGGGVDRPRTIEAQQVDQREEKASASTSLAEARMKVALGALNSIKQRISKGNGVLNRDALICLWSRRLLIAQLDMSKSQTDRIAIFKAYLAQMKDLEERANVHYSERRISDLEQMDAVFHRMEAESWLMKVKQGQVPWIIVVHS
jgi:hypothetical protein